MKGEIQIFPNPNQLILLREIQKKVCKIPCLPLSLTCPELKSLSDKISRARVHKFFISENKVILKFDMEINGKECEGQIELGKAGFLPKNPESILPEQIKTLSPFRIVKIEKSEFQNGLTWKILQEKWVKIR